MKTHRYITQLRSNKYYTDKHIYHNYQEDKQLILFLISVDNILTEVYLTENIGIRYSEQKELLKVLKFVLDNYKLYEIDNIYLSGNYYSNDYHKNKVGPREALVSSLIYELNKSLGYLNSTNYNLCLDFLNNFSLHLFENKVNKEIISLELRRELDFSGKFSISSNGVIDKKYYLNYNF